MRDMTESEWSEVVREEQQYDDYMDEFDEDEYEYESTDDFLARIGYYH